MPLPTNMLHNVSRFYGALGSCCCQLVPTPDTASQCADRTIGDEGHCSPPDFQAEAPSLHLTSGPRSADLMNMNQKFLVATSAGNRCHHCSAADWACAQHNKRLGGWWRATSQNASVWPTPARGLCSFIQPVVRACVIAYQWSHLHSNAPGNLAPFAFDQNAGSTAQCIKLTASLYKHRSSHA